MLFNLFSFAPTVRWVHAPLPAVGLDSGIKVADFKRKRLNLIILLDVSGSMSSPFDLYYYDQFTGARKKLNETGERARLLTWDIVPSMPDFEVLQLVSADAVKASQASAFRECACAQDEHSAQDEQRLLHAAS